MEIEQEITCPKCGHVHIEIIYVELSDYAPDYGWRD